MALIKQVKVGGVTYEIAMKAGRGIEITGTGLVEAKLGSGLCFGSSGEICASGVITGVGSGFMTGNGLLELNLGSGLMINDNGELDIK